MESTLWRKAVLIVFWSWCTSAGLKHQLVRSWATKKCTRVDNVRIRNDINECTKGLYRCCHTVGALYLKNVCIDIIHTIHTSRISQFPTTSPLLDHPFMLPLDWSQDGCNGSCRLPKRPGDSTALVTSDIRHAHGARGFQNRLVRLVEVTKGQCEVTKVTTTFVKQDDVDPWRMELRGLEGSLEQRDLRQLWWFLMVSIGFFLGTKLDVQMYRPTTREV